MAQAEFTSAEQAKEPGTRSAAGRMGTGDIIEAFIMEQIQV